MKIYLRRFARSTAADPARVSRLRERLGLTAEPEPESRGILSGALSADEGAIDRVRARLAYGDPARSTWTPARVAMAAATLLAVAGTAATSAVWWSTEAPMDSTLATVTPEAVNPTPFVALRYSGDGHVGGTAEAPRIVWTRGVLNVEVEPNRGVQLSVHTAEAEVRVIGTGFDVVRDARGTRVSVAHGRVSVVCEGGDAALLQAGESKECAPTSAAGLLGRAQALRQRGASNTEVLEAAERGLGAPHDEALAAELTLVRAEMLAALDRHGEALAVAATATEAGAGARQVDLQHLAAREGLRAQGCDAASPYLRQLRDHNVASPAELVLLADCVAPTDPTEARAALITALRLGVPTELEDAVVERLIRVGGQLP